MSIQMERNLRLKALMNDWSKKKKNAYVSVSGLSFILAKGLY